MDKKMHNLFFFFHLKLQRKNSNTWQFTSTDPKRCNALVIISIHLHSLTFMSEVPLVFVLQDWFWVQATCCSYSNSTHILHKWVTLVMPCRNNCNPSPHSKTVSNMSNTEDLLWCCLHSKSSQTDPSKVVTADSGSKNCLHIDHRTLWF